MWHESEVIDRLVHAFRPFSRPENRKKPVDVPVPVILQSREEWVKVNPPISPRRLREAAKGLETLIAKIPKIGSDGGEAGMIVPIHEGGFYLPQTLHPRTRRRSRTRVRGMSVGRKRAFRREMKVLGMQGKVGTRKIEKYFSV